MIHVTVTRHDIESGMPASSKDCAIAIALKRVEGLDPLSTRVGHTIIKADISGRHVALEPTLFMKSWMKTFDCHKSLALPFSFDIDLEKREIINCNLDNNGEVL